MTFIVARRDSELLRSELAPGATLWQRWRLADWDKSLPRGLVFATATWRATDRAAYHGTMTTSFAIDIR